MSHNRLLLGTSNDRRLFTYEVYNEMNDNAIANTHGRENQEIYFFQLVQRNEQLSEMKNKHCREYFIYDF